jgi:hypothetical protein
LGILFDSVMSRKRKFLIEELTKLKVFKSQTGKSIDELDYEELKYELVLASFREIDINSGEGKWF